MFSSNESKLKLPYQKNGWDFFITENLQKLSLVDHDQIWIDKQIKPFSKIPENYSRFLTQYNQHYPLIGLNQFKIQKVQSAHDQVKLTTNNLSSCYALAAQIYQKDQLTDIGLAHCMNDLDIPRQFFEEIVKTTNNEYDYINLFICGGCSNTLMSNNIEQAVKEALHNARDVRLIHDVSKQLYKKVKIVHEETLYRGDLIIQEVSFDDNFNPRICMDVQIEGFNFRNLFSSPSTEHIRCGFY